MTLTDKIAAHLMNEAKLTPVQQLQKDLMKVRDIRVNEYLTLKSVNSTVKESELIKALRQKGLTLSDVIDIDGMIVNSELRKHNIHLS